jgi:glycyl-tRNA synthetase beta chain
LLEENLGLIEEPFVVSGGFDEAYLQLPDKLILDVMRTHQRYFGVRKSNGELLPAYLAVANTALAPDTIAKGNNRAIRARLSDARFFVETDRKAGFDTYANKLSSVRYHAKLGSLADKTQRIAAASVAIGEFCGYRHLHAVEQTARLCKVDLCSLTVGEFPEMQGYAGKDMALAEGLPDEIAEAIAHHWLDGSLKPASPIGYFVGLADKFDHLVGGFSAGLAPTSAQDPFALRRAFFSSVLAMFELADHHSLRQLPSLRWLIENAFATYEKNGPKLSTDLATLLADIQPFMRTRLIALFSEGVDVAGVEALSASRASRDVVESCIAVGFDDLVDLRARIVAVRDARGTPEFVRLAIAWKRAAKITEDVVAIDPDPKKFDHPAEHALWAAFISARSSIEQAVAKKDYQQAISVASRALADPVDTFFDRDRGVYVMADDIDVRQNRLRLLATIVTQLSRIGRLEMLDS